MTYRGFDLTPLLGALLTLVAGAITWASTKVSSAATAAKDERNAQAAMLRVGALVTSLLGRAWDTLSPKVQAAIADGKITPEERAALEASVAETLKSFVAEDELKMLAVALRLPLPGLIAKIASMMLATFTKAHDPETPEVSSFGYPVANEEEAELDRLRAGGG